MSINNPNAEPIDDDVVRTIANLAAMDDQRIALKIWESVRPTLAREVVAARRSIERQEQAPEGERHVRKRTGLIVAGHTAIDRHIRYSGVFKEDDGTERQRAYVYNSSSDEVATRRGGIAANICFGATRLGLRPTLISAVGAGEGRGVLRELEACGVDTRHVVLAAGGRTPRFSCVTDANFKQYAVFEPGVSDRQIEVGLDAVAGCLPQTDLVVITSGPIAGMLKAKGEARHLGLRHLVDPAALIRWGGLRGPGVRELVMASDYVVVTEHDLHRVLALAKWSKDELLSRIGVLVTTDGSHDVTIEQEHVATQRVPIAITYEHAEPTGVSDAFRAGLSSALSVGLQVDLAARVGCVLASCAFETIGAQGYQSYSLDDILKRLSESYGDAVAEEVSEALSWSEGSGVGLQY